MTFNESAYVFSVGGDECVGVLHRAVGQIGVLILVGGPQYRVGSHRQYVQLSRKLAKGGIPSFRFDYRGMGDSTGVKQTFDNVDSDVRAALDAFEEHSGLKRFVILGLCDAASAAWIYSYNDQRVEGLVLVNPWLKHHVAQGRVMLKHYYPHRLFSKVFWLKLFAGEVNLKGILADAFQFAKKATNQQIDSESSYETRMLDGAEAFSGKTCLILSGSDLTAREFEQIALNNKSWKKVLAHKIEIHNFKDADHTFSTLEQNKQLQNTIFAFTASLD